MQFIILVVNSMGELLIYPIARSDRKSALGTSSSNDRPQCRSSPVRSKISNNKSVAPKLR
ncbi:MAG: hypothetical protein JGK17_13770 [Microcoleus sp. PH2017_10_PVI_O_A]|uniref:hypothetical protein n=1 Tax=unclassified Microcoleus TaxID=2642155 RepID=UPI001DE6F175|nr:MULTISPECIES: hypothetical protein [unclassified Microcoleus]TAE82545.1 MAG: hypothetical protein EAZ83_11815 [Oscillatoriales cyanobacterium]MCC3406631.1 hypothetical protein [Microcoleus sp. PH2017_10_PVI_O_A]MCC3460643.1 hypothetical protein [Microcoleus sp. PH2017_11_PCY_U_A]MCC3479190.1 hypothetical protein [Microcoleus sp. PH2017_12_PCY_D_A]MCC3560031.1 hypothetical protein [Microcoleus sp. PH2017_27_LUM_O_A]